LGGGSTKGRREREGRRGELTTGSTDDNNRSPGSTLGHGEVEEGEGGYFAWERENGGKGGTHGGSRGEREIGLIFS
jgi:hypothetical protein